MQASHPIRAIHPSTPAGIHRLRSSSVGRHGQRGTWLASERREQRQTRTAETRAATSGGERGAGIALAGTEPSSTIGHCPGNSARPRVGVVLEWLEHAGHAVGQASTGRERRFDDAGALRTWRQLINYYSRFPFVNNSPAPTGRTCLPVLAAFFFGSPPHHFPPKSHLPRSQLMRHGAGLFFFNLTSIHHGCRI